MSSLIFRKGLDLKDAVAGTLAASYHSALVEAIKADDFTYRSGRLTVYLAREFGFCYGVDRAVDYAYQARTRFPNRPVHLTGEIIHNPHVNEQLRGMGVGFLSDDPTGIARLGANDVVILPAFGVTMDLLRRLDRQGCTLVDTTCGSVLNVWKNVRRYAENGFTAIIHGKVWHEETQATASQAMEYGGRYLVVLDDAEAEAVCDYIRGNGEPRSFLAKFDKAASPGFDPDLHLARVGLANQTTMLMSESLRIAEAFKLAMIDRYGAADLDAHFQSFDTICSATQDRQDAILTLLAERQIDMVIVIGGYNSSNTCNLARLCANRTPTYHIADPSCLLSADEIRHRPIGSKIEVAGHQWLAAEGSVAVGLTSGASTPDNLVEATIVQLDRLCRA